MRFQQYQGDLKIFFDVEGTTVLMDLDDAAKRDVPEGTVVASISATLLKKLVQSVCEK